MKNINNDFKKDILNQVVKKMYGIPLFLENGNINKEFLKKFFPKLKELDIKQLEWKRLELKSENEPPEYQKLNIEFDDKDGILSFIQTKEDYVKFLVEYCLNEIDAIHNSIQQIDKELHNDRISDISSAMELYEKAISTGDIGQKKTFLINAETILTNGLHKIKREMEQHITSITNLPKSRVAKLFCGTKVSQIENIANELKEAFSIYQQGLFLMLHLDAELGEPNRAITTIKQVNLFLENTVLKNTERLNQFDIQYETFWLERPQLFYQKLNEVQKLISSSEDIFEMEG